MCALSDQGQFAYVRVFDESDDNRIIVMPACQVRSTFMSLEKLTCEQYIEKLVTTDVASGLPPGADDFIARNESFELYGADCSAPIFKIATVALFLHDHPDINKRDVWTHIFGILQHAHKHTLTAEVCFDAATLPAARAWVRKYGRLPRMYRNSRTTIAVVRLNTLVRIFT